MKQFEDFLNEAHRLKILYANQIKIVIGLETEFITGQDLEDLEVLLKRHSNRVEYLVGSIHHVNGIPIDFDFLTYQKAVESFGPHGSTTSLESFLLAYFDSQFELLQRFRPEVVGHFDLCRLYTPKLRFSDYPSVWQKVERNIAYIVGYGGLFEINAAAFRKKWDTPYPGTDVIQVGYHLIISQATPDLKKDYPETRRTLRII